MASLPSLMLLLGACGEGEVTQAFGNMDYLSFKYVVMGAFEPKVERAGGDYASQELAESDPVPCMQACEADESCMAWTLVKAAEGQPSLTTCHLKSYISPAEVNENAVSGVKIPGIKKGTSIIQYQKPAIKGRRLDWCGEMALDYPSVNSSLCGLAVADTYCKQQGHLKSIRYEIEKNIGEISPTFMISTEMICDTRDCNGFEFIDCMMLAYEKRR